MVYGLVLLLSRWVLPALSLLLAVCWVVKFRNARLPRTALAYLETRSGQILPIYVREGYIGRKRWCDVCLPSITVSGKHAVFFEQENKWFLAPAKGAVYHHGRLLKQATCIADGDMVVIAGEEMFFYYGAPKRFRRLLPLLPAVCCGS